MANQRRGYETERKCYFELDSRGFYTARSAGSKGPYDIFAIGGGLILLIQVKRTKAMARRAEPKYIRALRSAPSGGMDNIRKQLWTWVDREGWFVVELGPQEGHDFQHWGLPECVINQRRTLDLKSVEMSP